MLTLYYSPGTASLVVHWLLIELDVPHELQLARLRFATSRSRPNTSSSIPTAWCPTLVIDGEPLFEAGGAGAAPGRRASDGAAGAAARQQRTRPLLPVDPVPGQHPAARVPQLVLPGRSGRRGQHADAVKAERASASSACWDRIDAHLARTRPVPARRAAVRRRLPPDHADALVAQPAAAGDRLARPGARSQALMKARPSFKTPVRARAAQRVGVNAQRPAAPGRRHRPGGRLVLRRLLAPASSTAAIVVAPTRRAIGRRRSAPGGAASWTFARPASDASDRGRDCSATRRGRSMPTSAASARRSARPARARPSSPWIANWCCAWRDWPATHGARHAMLVSVGRRQPAVGQLLPARQGRGRGCDGDASASSAWTSCSPGLLLGDRSERRPAEALAQWLAPAGQRAAAGRRCSATARSRPTIVATCHRAMLRRFARRAQPRRAYADPLIARWRAPDAAQLQQRQRAPARRGRAASAAPRRPGCRLSAWKLLRSAAIGASRKGRKAVRCCCASST